MSEMTYVIEILTKFPKNNLTPKGIEYKTEPVISDLFEGQAASRFPIHAF